MTPVSEPFKMPKTLTEAAERSGLAFAYGAENATTSRTVPYAELYRERTAVIATPVEMIQRAAQDEQMRAAGR